MAVLVVAMLQGTVVCIVQIGRCMRTRTLTGFWSTAIYSQIRVVRHRL